MKPIILFLFFVMQLITPMTETLAQTPELSKQLQQALQARGADYEPRTEHFDTRGKPKYTNRLILETSPYLIQHAHNPVDWYSWSPEAFAAAKQQNKPIFLSIGYSTCHWCHVMERESFENIAIANLLNTHYIAIKVDREQRPDIDDTYMTAVTLMTKRGGWPMSSFLTAEGKPFYGGTYFPPEQFSQLLTRIDTLWKEELPGVLQQADNVANAVAQAKAGQGRVAKLSTDSVDKAMSNILAGYDDFFGGFSQAPKFPNEPILSLMLDHITRTDDKQALEALTTTLDSMARGGIYDQIAGGFHRYSTDAQWLVPHFEKMLYNQAWLGRIYAQAWHLTGNENYKRIAEQTLDYVLRDITSPQGAFYSATDADSEGEEGTFFLWTQEQIEKAVGSDDAQWLQEYYDLSKVGNFEGKTILNLQTPSAEFASKQGLTLPKFYQKLDKAREQLRLVREQRQHPLRDEKIITSWNGMMIATLATASHLLQRPDYRAAAEKAASYLLKHNRNERGELQRVSLHGKPSILATQEDYAYLAESLVRLFDVSRNKQWLDEAVSLTDTMLEHFQDKQQGGMYQAQLSTQITAMQRAKDDGHDGATPSGSSLAMNLLQMLYARTERLDYRQNATQLLDSLSASIEASPASHSYLLTAANNFWQGETDSYGYAAHGGVFVRGTINSANNTLDIEIQVTDGWHINDHEVISDKLIATKMTLAGDHSSAWKLGRINWPQAETADVAFLDTPLPLYQGTILLQASLTPVKASEQSKLIAIDIQLQACSTEVCLPPEKVTVRVNSTSGGSS